ncbi:TraG family conjugative transposon ATPase [Desertivirga brevis]|uniref:TraG family conjugative transposon ATPase n=1 Tax=Desertivirga brevis TaxID=2810310 RepID=UPI001A969DE5|nr:TraG family conjugative transposon ATPase [Pedobacter sp. SYSU D00873]
MKAGKNTFSLPYAGIDNDRGKAVLYTMGGEFSVVFELKNPVLQYTPDPDLYENFHLLMLNLVKILGEGYIIQKQDLFVRDSFQGRESEEFLTQKYNQHFRGRCCIRLKTYLVITRRVRKGAFFVYDGNALNQFHEHIAKVWDLLGSAGIDCRLLEDAEIDTYLKRLMALDFTSGNIVLNNFRSTPSQLESGTKAIRIISLVDSETVDLPESVSPYTLRSEGTELRNFPCDNMTFLATVPQADIVLYNQVIEIPPQQSTLHKLELKKKRHSGVPDPANLLCVEDIAKLLGDVARDNQLIVYAHFSIAVSSPLELIDKAVNYIESALFQNGIIPSANAYNQLELFRCLLPGNSVALKEYDKFLTTAEASICLLFKERFLQDEASDFLIYFTDRQGIPVGLDPSDLPLRTGRMNNRNRFVLGPSGSGKSFLMNSLIQQYMNYNMDVVIVDTGHSYSGLCSYFNGRYITYSEKKPITMNPFLMHPDEYNIEKKDFLCTLIGLLWKGSEGDLNGVERDVVSSTLSAYYSCYFNLSGDPEPQVSELSFNSFYDFAVQRIPEIKKEERIHFDLDEFRYVLKKFYRGGEFDSILNEASDSSLFSERFVVFEIDAVKENKILFPIVTLIIMDVFIQKMRNRKEQRKALIIEEAWKAIASPLMSGYILYLYKTVRKFWGEAIVVTQELSDILGNAVVKDSILSNSDTVFLLDQSKFRENYAEIARLLAISEVEQQKIFTINKLNNREGRRFKEVYIRRGTVGEVYGVEVSIYQYLAYTTEKPEKTAVEIYVDHYASYQQGLEALVSDLETSSLSLTDFVKRVNAGKVPLY